MVSFVAVISVLIRMRSAPAGAPTLSLGAVGPYWPRTRKNVALEPAIIVARFVVNVPAASH